MVVGNPNWVSCPAVAASVPDLTAALYMQKKYLSRGFEISNIGGDNEFGGKTSSPAVEGSNFERIYKGRALVTDCDTFDKPA